MRQFVFFFRVLILLFVFCLDADFVTGQSAYLEEVVIPEYDPSNSEHFLISTTSDWSHINDRDKHYFYVKPHVDYGQRTISADGTKSAPRYISLYNGNNTHPAKLSPAEQANIRLVFIDAHYWIVDRMSSLNYGTHNAFCYEIKSNSGNIIFNRFNLDNFYEGFIIRGTTSAPFTHDITIQNSRFNNMSPAGIDGDAVAILLMGNYWNKPGTVKNTKILDNEIKNCNDGIMPIKMPQFEGNGTYYVDYPGTIIDNNHIYVDTAVYTDGNGNHDPNGKWALTENAVDIKCGSNDPDNPMIVSNNYFWGYRRTDQHGGGSGSWGTALGAHYNVKNLIIENNVIFNSNRGIALAGFEELPDYPTAENVMITGNLLYDIGYATIGGTGYCNVFGHAKDIRFEKNTIVGKDKRSYWADNLSTKNLSFTCNVIISSEQFVGSRNSVNMKNNSFFDTQMQQPGDGTYYSSADSANMADLIFVTDRFTNNPREITLPGVLTTESTPHAEDCSPASNITYYVDFINGDDSWSGTSVSSPWKTISKVNNTSFSGGNRILFKRNETWNEKLIFSSSGTSFDPIEIGAYGTGNKPVITVNNEYSGTWSNQGGNIWKIADLGFHPWRVRVEGEEKLLAVSMDELDGQKYFWYIDADDSLGNVTSADIYLYSVVDPNMLLVELSEDILSIQLNGVHDVKVRDLDIQGGRDGCFSIIASSRISLVNDKIGAYARFGVTISNSHDIVIDSCMVDAHFEFEYDVSSQRGPQDGITTWGNVKNLEVKNSIIRTWGHNCIYFNGYNSTVPGYHKVHHCLLEGINSYSRAFETGGSASYNEFYNNIVRHFTASSQVGGNHNFFHHNIFYDFRNSPVKDYPIGQVFTFQQFEGDPDTDNRIENNIFADIDEQALNYIAGGQWTGSVEHNTFKNNIIYNAGRNPGDSTNTGVAIKWPSCDAVVGENYSNNCIYSPHTTATIIYRGTKMTVEQFNHQNGTNEDVIQNNISMDPLLIDVANRDFHLKDSSSCINAGLLVPGMDKDFDGNDIPYGKSPDIGAYEYTGTLPTIASFDYTVNACNYEVSFEGHAQSNETPGWGWNFGDGSKSMLQNPVHKYDTLGTYLVSLVVFDGKNTDVCLKEITIVQGLEMPEVSVAERCGSGTLTLIASGGGGTQIRWYDVASGDGLVANGDTFTTPPLSATKTYYVASVIPGEPVTLFGGKPDNNGDGGYYEWDDPTAIRGLVFNVHKSIILKTVKVYNDEGQAATRTITVVDRIGKEIATKQVNIPEGENRIELNFQINPGKSYFIKAADPHKGLYRNSSGVSYPYLIDNAVTITSSGLDINNYYFFYDWEIEITDDSSSCRKAVDAIVNPLAKSQFNYVVNDNEVSFINTSTGESYLWNFGDGTSSTEENPVHDYSGYDSCLVKLVVTNSCGSDSTEKYVIIDDVTSSYSVPYDDPIIHIFPNPCNDVICFHSNIEPTAKTIIQIYNSIGLKVKIVETDYLNAFKMNISDLVPAIYFMKIETNHASSSKLIKFIILR
jgi:PKD repeat protein